MTNQAIEDPEIWVPAANFSMKDVDAIAAYARMLFALGKSGRYGKKDIHGKEAVKAAFKAWESSVTAPAKVVDRVRQYIVANCGNI